MSEGHKDDKSNRTLTLMSQAGVNNSYT